MDVACAHNSALLFAARSSNVLMVHALLATGEVDPTDRNPAHGDCGASRDCPLHGVLMLPRRGVPPHAPANGTDYVSRHERAADEHVEGEGEGESEDEDVPTACTHHAHCPRRGQHSEHDDKGKQATTVTQGSASEQEYGDGDGDGGVGALAGIVAARSRSTPICTCDKELLAPGKMEPTCPLFLACTDRWPALGQLLAYMAAGSGDEAPSSAGTTAPHRHAAPSGTQRRRRRRWARNPRDVLLRACISLAEESGPHHASYGSQDAFQAIVACPAPPPHV